MLLLFLFIKHLCTCIQYSYTKKAMSALFIIWNKPSFKFLILLVGVSMNFWIGAFIYWFVYKLWVVVSMIYCVYELLCLWREMSINNCVYKRCLLLGVSLNCCVYELLCFWIMSCCFYDLLCQWVIVSNKWNVYELLYLWFLCLWIMSCCVYEVKCLWIVVSMSCCVYGLLCLWIVVSMNCCVYELLCLWIVVSMNCCVYKLLCLWIDVSMNYCL